MFFNVANTRENKKSKKEDIQYLETALKISSEDFYTTQNIEDDKQKELFEATKTANDDREINDQITIEDCTINGNKTNKKMKITFCTKIYVDDIKENTLEKLYQKIQNMKKKKTKTKRESVTLNDILMEDTKDNRTKNIDKVMDIIDVLQKSENNINTLKTDNVEKSMESSFILKYKLKSESITEILPEKFKVKR